MHLCLQMKIEFGLCKICWGLACWHSVC